MTMRVIVAAKSYLNRQILENTTRKAGYSDIDALSTGQEVLETMENTDVDVVIMEKHLEDLTAIQLADHIQSRPTLTDTSIIIFADEFTSDEAVEAIRSGVRNLLIKPVLPEQLREKVEALD